MPYFGPNTQEIIEHVGFVVDNNGAVITTGTKGYIRIPYSGTITAWTILSTVSGSVQIDIKKCDYASYPTTTSITASAKPTLSSTDKNTSSTLTGWTTSVTEGDVLEWVIDSATTVTKMWFFLELSR